MIWLNWLNIDNLGLVIWECFNFGIITFGFQIDFTSTIESLHFYYYLIFLNRTFGQFITIQMIHLDYLWSVRRLVRGYFATSNMMESGTNRLYFDYFSWTGYQNFANYPGVNSGTVSYYPWMVDLTNHWLFILCVEETKLNTYTFTNVSARPHRYKCSPNYCPNSSSRTLQTPIHARSPTITLKVKQSDHTYFRVPPKPISIA